MPVQVAFDRPNPGTGRPVRRAGVVALSAVLALGSISLPGPAAATGAPPIAAPDGYAVAKDVAADIDAAAGLLANDTDAESDPLTAALETVPSHGLLLLDADGSFSYSPDPGYVGIDTFTYRAADDAASSAPALVTITVTNDAPEANPDAAVVLEDSSGNVIDPLANDTDANGDTIRFAAIHQPAHGHVTVVGAGAAATVRYAPDADWFGTDTFTYWASDGDDATLGTVTVEVANVNDPPSFAGGGPLTSDEDVVVAGMPWAGSISDGAGPEHDGRLFEVTANDNPALFAAGPSVDAAGAVSFEPARDASGEATLSVRLSDDGGTANGGDATGNTAELVIRILPVNDGPACDGDHHVAVEDVPYAGSVTGCSDVEGDSLTYALTTPPAHGDVELSPDGTFTYRPAPDWNGTDSFAYEAGDGALVGAGTAEVVVDPANDDPVITLGTSPTAAEDSGTRTFAGWATGIGPGGLDDESGQVLEAAITVDRPELFAEPPALDPATGTLRFGTAPNANGAAVATLVLVDNEGGRTTRTFSITLTSVNDAPVFPAEPAEISVPEDAGWWGGQFSLSDLGFDDSADTAWGAPFPLLEQVGMYTPAHGDVSATDFVNGTIRFMPDADYFGPDAFRIEICDRQWPNGGGTRCSGFHDVIVTVVPVNDPPSFSYSGPYAIHVAEDSGPYAQPWAFDMRTGPANEAETGTFTVSNTMPSLFSVQPSVDPVTGVLSFTPAPDAYNAVILTVDYSDGTDTASHQAMIWVDPVTDGPRAAADTFTVTEDEVTTLAVRANDIHPDHTYTWVYRAGPAEHGTVAISPDQSSVRYTPHADYTGPDSFSYTIHDGRNTATATVSLTVMPANDAPVAAPAAFTGDEDADVDLALTATDVDGDTPAFAIASEPAHGAVVVDPATGLGTYTPTPDWNGIDTFTFTATDGALASAPATVSVTVTPVNDAPVASDGAVEGTEDTVAGLALAAADVDGDDLWFAVTAQPAHGLVALDPAIGGATYTPDAEWSGIDTFAFTVTDGTLTSGPATVTVTVAPANDDPVAADDAYGLAEDGRLEAGAEAGLLANDTDIDGDPLQVEVATDPAHGTLDVASDGAFTYVPAPDFAGTDTFAYRAVDGVAGGLAQVILTVAPVNDAPVCADGPVSVVEDVPLRLVFPCTDVDGDPLTIAIASGPAHGHVALGLDPEGDPLGTGSWYVPDPDVNGADRFTYAASDGQVASNVATALVTVQPVNDAPVAVDDAGRVPQGAARTFDVLANDLDVDGDLLELVDVTGAGMAATASIVDGGIRVVPAPAFHGVLELGYTIADGAPASTDIGWLVVTVDPDATAPVAEAPRVVVGGPVDARVPATVSWVATDAGTGVASYEAEVSIDGGAWAPFAAGPATSRVTGLASGHRYAFRVRATDRAGNVSPFGAAATVRPRIRQADRGLTYRGRWSTVTAASASGGSYVRAGVRGRSVSYTFTGRELLWVAPTNARSGRAAVFIDGDRVATVNLSSATARHGQVVFRTAFARPGTHTIRIVVLTTGRRVGVDAFVVLR